MEKSERARLWIVLQVLQQIAAVLYIVSVIENNYSESRPCHERVRITIFFFFEPVHKTDHKNQQRRRKNEAYQSDM